MSKIISFVFAATVFAAQLLAAEPKELEAARKDYQVSAPHPTEADREQYVTKLAAMRARMAAKQATEDWQAVDAELRRHPLPKNADSKTLSKTIAGQWTSPRHEYIFRLDGTWTMLPAEPGATHGRWHIEGNKFFNSAGGEREDQPYTMILLTRKDLIYTDGKVVFYETRSK